MNSSENGMFKENCVYWMMIVLQKSDKLIMIFPDESIMDLNN